MTRGVVGAMRERATRAQPVSTVVQDSGSMSGVSSFETRSPFAAPAAQETDTLLPVRCSPFTDPEAFARVALPLLLASEERYCLQVGIVSGLATRPRDDAVMLAVTDDGDAPGEIVAMASFMGQTPGGRGISLVYTPPEFRKRGYATALVAYVSRTILASGKRFCSLFTDLANPTSNAIYRRIGYLRVAEFSSFTVGDRRE